ncbi:NADP-dependent oxidoreductase domain-containing protein [Scenedesmus sp. NREL 46B-D3]|nr:NADP-dependent oxidoreductase domain-containing protein [Scenedesmus sp. NREL 46B-D3]
MQVQQAATVKTLAGLQMPRMLYGTAWKKERTAELVEQAVLTGFRGIDTACQPKHYREDLVGRALQRLQQVHGIPRSSLFIQTKFTSMGGQDRSQPLPYDPAAPLPEQVRQSFATSLANLHTQHIDSLVLHSPMPSHNQSMEVWRAFEELADSGQVSARLATAWRLAACAAAAPAAAAAMAA